MEMDFTLSRRKSRPGSGKADYFALVANATAVQATSPTVSALLARQRASVAHVNVMDGRLAFFGQRGTSRICGAFLPDQSDRSDPIEKFEGAVNRSDSANGKFVRLHAIKPELQVAERGTEF